MAAAIKFESAVDAIAKKKIDFSTDTFMLALVASANTPDASVDAVLADLTQISYTNLVGRTLTVSSAAEAGGVFTFDVNDFDLEASGGAVAAWQYIVLYSDTATNKDLLCYWDAASAVNMADTDIVNLVFDTVLMTLI